MKRFLMILLLSGAVPAMADLQTDMMNDRLDRLDREMTLLQKKVYAPRQITGGQGGADLAEAYGQLEEQNQVVSDLTQKVEELTHQQATLKAELDRLKADIDIRFQENGKIAPKSAEKTTVPPIPKAPPATDKEAYDKAYDLLVKGNYVEAERALRDFLATYPDSTLVGNANYWLGETYYVRGQYEVAAGIFSDGLTTYEKSTKAPDNLLKLGLTMAQLNKKAEACEFLKLLPEKFPDAGQILKQRAAGEAQKLACP